MPSAMMGSVAAAFAILVIAQMVTAVELGSASSSEGGLSYFNDDDDDGTAEDAEVNLADEVGDDWGDSALSEAQDMATRRMSSKNQRLEDSLAKLKQKNERLKKEMQHVSRAAAEAERFGHRIGTQIHALSMLAPKRASQVMHPDQAHRLGEADEDLSPEQIVETAEQTALSPKSAHPIADELKKIGLKPSKLSLGQDLLQDAINTGSDVKSDPFAGVFCTQLIDEGIVGHKDCNLGSKLTCNPYMQYCQIEKTNGVDVGVIGLPSCAAKGVVECEAVREKLGAEMWMEAKKKKDAADMKKAMDAAWMQARYQEAKRNAAAVESRQAGSDALDAALKQGADDVKTASLQGNAPLPEPQADKQIMQFKAEMRDMKFELMDKEKIFLSLRTVTPACSEPFEECSHTCDRTKTISDLAEATEAIMGRVTGCQMKCKSRVVNCVMSYVASTYKDVTVEAMRVGPQL